MCKGGIKRAALTGGISFALVLLLFVNTAPAHYFRHAGIPAPVLVASFTLGLIISMWLSCINMLEFKRLDSSRGVELANTVHFQYRNYRYT